MTPKEETIYTYTANAQAFSEKYDKSGVRVQDIDHIFANYYKENPFVFEIGYGNGRDAAYILRYTNKYKGIDISQALSEIARRRLPGVDFEIADVESYKFPREIDVVYASGSLLHVPIESLKDILRNLYTSVVAGGLVFVSVKASSHYKKVIQTDTYGTRTFWHYSKKDLRDVASGFEIESITESKIGNQDWLEVLYKKN